ncbi:hypothetical protein BBF96_14430 [Anoxybacter fermentans]|uniref:DUF1468 domain-containing protein n=1 Tax=Anoxybacter fermentans TaxID=1323375 RepID=A0A3S9T1V0_9FIRM|nr:tripartite tricarboxylate transporter TctB family protein [Anoxybacter fermentans]AZR74475.1 hypothetical protein BBF96_14430 [Anoxybacter fermentans]
MDQQSKFDILIAISLSLISFLVFWISKDFPTLQNGIGPSAFPKILAGLLIIFSIVLVFKAVRNESKRPAIFKGFTKGLKLILVVVIILISYIKVIEILGFILSSSLLLFILMFIFGEKRKMVLTLVPIGFTVILYLAFKKLAMVPLPEGIIEKLFG